MSTAPIALFVYNRPWHTRETVKALLENELSAQSDLIIFSDGAKSNDDVQQVQEVRDYLKSISGFRSIRIVERKENWGLAQSIISGVTEVVEEFGKIIVLEDDIVTSPAFLQFMNKGLDFYKQEKKVWHISGWTYPIDNESLNDTYLWRVMNCWGWATWADRWQHFEKNPIALIDNWSAEERYQFDLEGAGSFWSQVEENFKGKINTWAIFWYVTIFQNRGLCLNPVVSYVDNIGHDGSGVHCGSEPKINIVLNLHQSIGFTKEIYENDIARERIKKYIRPSIFSRFKRYFIK